MFVVWVEEGVTHGGKAIMYGIVGNVHVFYKERRVKEKKIDELLRENNPFTFACQCANEVQMSCSTFVGAIWKRAFHNLWQGSSL